VDSRSPRSRAAQRSDLIDSRPMRWRWARKHRAEPGAARVRNAWLEADVLPIFAGCGTRRLVRSDRLDPPKFARRPARGARARAYKDINLLALKLLARDGLLVTFSCSSGIAADLFQKIVAGAALDAGASAQILRRLHCQRPIIRSRSFPEATI